MANKKEGIKLTAYDIFCEFRKSENRLKRNFYTIFKFYLETLDPPIEVTPEDFERNKIGILSNMWNGDIYGLRINGKEVYIDDLVEELDK